MRLFAVVVVVVAAAVVVILSKSFEKNGETLKKKMS